MHKVRVLFLPLLLVLPVQIRAESQRTITVQAEGEVSAVPDRLSTRFWIVRQGKDLPETKQAVDDQARAFKKVLADAGVADDEFRIMQLQVMPQYDWRQGKKFLGYEVRREIELRLKQIELFGTLLDKAIAAGINHTGHVQLELSNKGELETQAAANAVQAAARKAAVIAEAAGAKLGEVLEILESGDAPAPMRAHRAMAMAEADSGPVEHVGESIIRKTVTVTYALQ